MTKNTSEVVHRFGSLAQAPFAYKIEDYYSPEKVSIRTKDFLKQFFEIFFRRRITVHSSSSNFIASVP
jgi:hypothetical protein